MPLYLIYGLDHRPNGLALRRSTRPDHLAWIEGLGDRVKLAGPLLQSDGETPAGTMMIIACDTLDAAQHLAAEDPYARAGVFASQEVRPFNWLIHPPA
ncbi:hypothetical protein GC169_09790 [bacterium]|nr:hypothetical protein [bacterium]